MSLIEGYRKHIAKKKEKYKRKTKTSYFISREDLNFLLTNTRFSEQEIR